MVHFPVHICHVLLTEPICGAVSTFHFIKPHGRNQIPGDPKQDRILLGHRVTNAVFHRWH